MVGDISPIQDTSVGLRSGATLRGILGLDLRSPRAMADTGQRSGIYVRLGPGILGTLDTKGRQQWPVKVI